MGIGTVVRSHMFYQAPKILLYIQQQTASTLRDKQVSLLTCIVLSSGLPKYARHAADSPACLLGGPTEGGRRSCSRAAWWRAVTREKRALMSRRGPAVQRDTPSMERKSLWGQG